MSYQTYFDLQDGTGYRDVSAYIASDSLVVTTRAFNESYTPAQNTATFKLVYDATLYNLLLAQTKDILVRIVEVILAKDICTENDEEIATAETHYLSTGTKRIVTETSTPILIKQVDTLITEDAAPVRLFQGHMAPSYERTYNGIMYATQLSCSAEDDLSYLDTPIADPDVLELIGGVVYTSCKVCDPSNPTNSIVHKLAAIKGLSVSSTCSIPTVIAKFAPENETDTIKDVMAKLLYEYGYTLFIDAYGIINPVLYRKATDTTAVYTFSDANIIKEVSITETVQDYDGAYVTYYESKKAEKILLYRDDNCGYNDDGTFAGYSVLSGYKYPPETNVIDDTTGTWTKVYQEYTDEAIKYWTNKAVANNLDYNYKAFSSDFSSIIATENQYQYSRVDSGIVADSTTEFYNKKCRIVWKNPEPTAKKIYYNNVYGDVYYRGVAKKLKIYKTLDVKPVSPYEYSMQFVFDETNASAFAGFISAQYISCRHTKYTLTSEDLVSVGSFVNITLGDGTNQACIVMSDEFDFTELQHKYVLISVATTALAINAKDTSVTVTADNTYSYGNQINIVTVENIAEQVANNTPIYRGKWLDTEPTTSVNGDWYVRYSVSSGTTNRGVFYKNSSGVWTRTTDSRYVGSGAINDIINICANSTYGTVADYGATYVQDLFSQYLKILTGGSIYGGDRFNSSGTEVNTTVKGFYLGADGSLKATLQSLFRSNILIGTDAGINITDTGDDSDYNVVVGDQAGKGVTGSTYYGNTLIGFAAGYSCTTGSNNTCIGDETGLNLTTSNFNTLIGSRAGQALVSDGFNTYIGTGVCILSTTGTHNVVIGNSACSSTEAVGTNNTYIGNLAAVNSTGNNNSFIGDNAGYNNTGSDSVCIGAYAAYEYSGGYSVCIGNDSGRSTTSGAHNTFVGYASGYGCTTGPANVFVGSSAGYGSTTGGQNTFVGCNAGYGNGSGGANTYLGYEAGYTSVGYTNCSILGYQAAVTGNSQIQLGNSTTTTYVYGTVQNRSDKRDKTSIIDEPLGLAFINKLIPVQFKWDLREDYSVLNDDRTITELKKDGSKARSRYHNGFIAQDVKAVMDELKIDFGGYQDHSINGGKDVLSLGYDEFIAPMCKAIQELSAEVESLKAKIKEIK